MEKYLQTILVIGLLLLPWRYYYWPQILEIRKDKQEISNVSASLLQFTDGREAMYQDVVATQRKVAVQMEKQISFLLPQFSQARANLMAPFNEIRSSTPGQWKVTPEGRFTKSGNLISWPFEFQFIGSHSNAVKALGALETAEQFIRIQKITMETKIDQVELSGIVELIFLDGEPSVASEGVKP
ncbi:MAG: hypothetical protein WA705_24680 [Candidatus Ozemobacteraceae bacterium]